MAWSSLLSCRTLHQCLLGRTRLASVPLITLRIPYCFAHPQNFSRQLSSSSARKENMIEASSTFNDADLSAMRRAIIQAIQELPIMTNSGAKEYAEKCFAESTNLCQQGPSWSSTVPWLKGYISGIVYPNDLVQHDELAYSQCISPTLGKVYTYINSILSELAEHDQPNQSVYNMGILAQYLEMLDQRENRIELGTKFKACLDNLDLDNIDTAIRLDIERCHPLLDSLYMQFRNLTDDREDKLELTADILQGELRKGSILLFTGPEGRLAATPFFVSGHRCTVALESDTIRHEELLFAYQKQLPEAVFQRFLLTMHVYSQTHLISDRVRNALNQAMSELPFLTPETFEAYSCEQFEEVKQLRRQGRGHEYPTAVLMFKGILPRILYTKYSHRHGKLGQDVATTSTLLRFVAALNKVLENLHNEAPDDDSPYTLGIMPQFNNLFRQVEEGFEHIDAHAQYTTTLKNIEFGDMDETKRHEMCKLGYPIHDQFCTDLERLAGSVPEPALTEIAIWTELVELRKACILITAGGISIPHAVPYLVNTYYFTASLRPPEIALLLIYSYQQNLPPDLFERVMQSIWLLVHDEDYLTARLSLPSPPERGEEQPVTTQD
ncbi:hypothetical protein DL96DRAFT_1613533 [Flagelloscypha sp. PMI_526]|nr:hypothetical protein DL96DRAFT_1613533 [Flagelloscypha sp. PMI_526]